MTGESEYMQINTSRFGAIEINPERIITMSAPILGFPDCHRFILRPHKPESPFMWLQAVDNPELAFVVIQATTLDLDYKPVVPENIRKELKADRNKKLDTLLILTVPKEDPKKMTANLLGPVVINSEKKLARQIMLDPVKYNPCYPVF